jgi:hypothetical protein
MISKDKSENASDLPKNVMRSQGQNGGPWVILDPAKLEFTMWQLGTNEPFAQVGG